MKSIYLFALLIFFGHTYAQVDSAHPIVALIRQSVANVTLSDSLEASDDALVPFQKQIRAVAFKYHIPASLLAAVIQEESVFDPWATRFEPRYLRNRRIKNEAIVWSKQHGGVPTAQTELQDRSHSMGLMQPMGELARSQGFNDRYLSALYLPENSIEQGALLLKSLLKRYHGDTLSTISAYNQGNARKRHGEFENARYVYRVSVAWQRYHELFTHNTHDLTYDHHSHKKPGVQVGRSDYTGASPIDRNPIFRLPPRYADANAYGAPDGIRAGSSRYHDSSRYAVASPTNPNRPRSERTLRPNRDAFEAYGGNVGLFIAGFSAFVVACGVLGHHFQIKRHHGDGTGHAIGLS